MEIIQSERQKPIQATLQISEILPEGLDGNFNGWGQLWAICLESDISQQKTLTDFERPTEPEVEPLEAETEIDGFRNPNPPNTNHLFRRVKSTGKLYGWGELSYDRKPPEWLIVKRELWNTAVKERLLQEAHTRRPEAHMCEFCALSDDPAQTGPTWLYDRELQKSVRVAADLGGKIPPYQVLSYTWGRAANNSWETLEGIPWKLRSSISKPPSDVKKLVLGSFTSRYVWVDMFCIPQDCPAAKAWEVARQETIFRDARGGMAWLHQTFRVLPLYFGVYSWMQDIVAKFHHRETVQCPDFALSRLEELLKDPWFQSTWTLQEALLQPNLMLGGEGEFPEFAGFREGNNKSAAVINTVSVKIFCEVLGFLLSLSSEALHLSVRRQLMPAVESHISVADATKLYKLIRESGFYALVAPSPTSVLASLQIRTSVKAHDKYYGQQSIFGMKMLGDYNRPLSEVRREFLQHIWSRFAPVLALSLNKPIIPMSMTHLKDCQDALHYLSNKFLQSNTMSCCPEGCSTVRLEVAVEEGVTRESISFQAAESDNENPWRWEALCLQGDDSNDIPKQGPFTKSTSAGKSTVSWRRNGLGAERESGLGVRCFSIHYGLPPILVDLQNAKSENGKKVPIVKIKDDDYSGHPFFQYCNKNTVKTTRLLYVGKVINETGYMGMGRDLYVYIEYYLTSPDVGRRVGALCAEKQLKLYKVEHALTLR